ncbi:hypothetical protein ACQCT3_21605 [Sutcliffiella horikoshii]
MERWNGAKTREEEGVLSSYGENGAKSVEKKRTLAPFNMHTQ